MSFAVLSVVVCCLLFFLVITVCCHCLLLFVVLVFLKAVVLADSTLNIGIGPGMQLLDGCAVFCRSGGCFSRELEAFVAEHFPPLALRRICYVPAAESLLPEKPADYKDHENAQDVIFQGCHRLTTREAEYSEVDRSLYGDYYCCSCLLLLCYVVVILDVVYYCLYFIILLLLLSLVVYSCLIVFVVYHHCLLFVVGCCSFLLVFFVFGCYYGLYLLFLIVVIAIIVVGMLFVINIVIVVIVTVVTHCDYCHSHSCWYCDGHQRRGADNQDTKQT